MMETRVDGGRFLEIGTPGLPDSVAIYMKERKKLRKTPMSSIRLDGWLCHSLRQSEPGEEGVGSVEAKPSVLDFNKFKRLLDTQ